MVPQCFSQSECSVVNLLGAGSGKLQHYIVMQRCPLTWAPEGAWVIHQKKTLGGNVVQIKWK